ncbi:MAG: 4Fe-4S dicluster domain-containing protein [Eubacterium sp.]
MYKIALDSISVLFNAIAQKEKLYIPADKNDIAVFAEYSDGMEMTKKLNTNRSAKDFFFPQTESLYDVKMKDKKIEITDTRSECEDFAVFGVRACDVRSFSILDKVYLVDPIDTYYKNRREHGTIISLACNRPEETCFCGAFGINPAEPDGDAAAWISDDTLYIKSLTEKGEKLLSSISTVLTECDDNAADNQKEKINNIMSKLPLSKVSFEHMKDTDLLDHFKSEKWAELSEACIGCGTCTFVCPTCQCYDIREFDTGNGIKKFRCWDSCMYSDFTKMAHGNPRTSQLERFRQRFMHKLVYFPDNNNGEFGCVGCGRCLAKCPISMNIVKVAKALEVDS